MNFDRNSKGQVQWNSHKTREAVFELQVDAFIDGISDHEPDPLEYGLSEEQGQEIIGESLLRISIVM